MRFIHSTAQQAQGQGQGQGQGQHPASTCHGFRAKPAVARSAHEHVAIISADAHWPCVASPAVAALIVGLTAAATSEGAA